MAREKAEDEREIGQFLKEMTDGVTEELKTLIPHIDLSPKIPDAKIKKAILTISEPGMQKLFQRFGQHTVLSFIKDFSEGRKW